MQVATWNSEHQPGIAELAEHPAVGIRNWPLDRFRVPVFFGTHHSLRPGDRDMVHLRTDELPPIRFQNVLEPYELLCDDMHPLGFENALERYTLLCSWFS